MQRYYFFLILRHFHLSMAEQLQNPSEIHSENATFPLIDNILWRHTFIASPESKYVGVLK
jgi:hypothetical protein